MKKTPLRRKKATKRQKPMAKSLVSSVVDRACM